MRTTHPRLKFALIAALPLEAVNFWIVGYPAAVHPTFQLAQNPAVALQWYVLHLAGIIAIDHSIALRKYPRLDSVLLFIGGYIGTTILLLLILSIARIISWAFRKASHPLRRPA